MKTICCHHKTFCACVATKHYSRRSNRPHVENKSVEVNQLQSYFINCVSYVYQSMLTSQQFIMLVSLGGYALIEPLLIACYDLKVQERRFTVDFDRGFLALYHSVTVCKSQGVA